MDSATIFQWLSPLGISVMLFLLSGVLYLVIGVLTPILLESGIGDPIIIISHRADKKLFGDEPEKIMNENTQLLKLRRIMMPMLAGMLVVSGVFMITITWFGLKSGEIWAFITLAIAGLVLIPFWWLVFKQYFDEGIRITLTDAPPFIWIPTIIYFPAVALGWIGLYQG